MEKITTKKKALLWKSFSQNFPDITSNNSLGSVSAIMFQSLSDKAVKKKYEALKNWS